MMPTKVSHTEKLVKEVKGNNSSFSKGDIQAGVRVNLNLFCSIYTRSCYKSLSQEEILKRNGKHDQR